MAKKAKAQGKDLMVLTDRLDRLAVSNSNLKRLALEYISLKEISPEVREVLDTFLFLKDVPKNGAYYDWASRRLNPVLALWKHEGAERPSTAHLLDGGKAVEPRVDHRFPGHTGGDDRRISRTAGRHHRNPGGQVSEPVL